MTDRDRAPYEGRADLWGRIAPRVTEGDRNRERFYRFSKIDPEAKYFSSKQAILGPPTRVARPGSCLRGPGAWAVFRPAG